MTASCAFTLAPGILAMLLCAGVSGEQEKPAEYPDKRLALSKRNAAAEELESLALALGLDAHRGDPSAEHPSREDVEAYQRAGCGPWLDAQLRTADDSIAAVPASFQSFLEKRQPKSIFAIALPNRMAAIQRAGRLLVDRELTARVLEIRQEKAASRDRQWPVKFSDLDSRVCPGSSYEYQGRGAAMAIRFKGSIDDGGATLVLPLSFEVRAPRPTATPTRATPCGHSSAPPLTPGFLPA